MTTKALKERLQQLIYRNSGSTVISPGYPTICEMWLIGGGGGFQNSGGNAGGGGAESVWRRFRCPPGVTLTYAIGAGGVGNGVNGGNTVVTLPGGLVVSAQGGFAGFTTTPGAGGGFSGVVSLDEIHRAGGSGGASGTGGSAGDHGGLGGAPNAGGGGGGSGGFSDYGDLIAGGAGGGYLQNAGPGGGGAAGGYPSGAGQILMLFTRLQLL